MKGKSALAIKFEIALVTGEWHVRVMYVYHMKIMLTQSHIFGVSLLTVDYDFR